MRQLSFILIYLVIAANLFAQSPHGKDFKMDCSNCHSSTSWKEIPKTIKFNHDETSFKLTGQHKSVGCVNCHQSLIFSNAKDDCGSCHKSIHQNSVSPECSSCHTTQTWLITNINELHERSRFPLVGVHATLDCSQCHAKYSTLNFEVQGIECIDCHRKDFMSTNNPNHIQAGFSTDCQQCHLINQTNWAFANFAHDFFPLIGGHKINNCFACHQQGTFAGLSMECYSCHKKDYDATNNPNHVQANFSTDCVSCHTINGWSPSTFNHNSTAFPLTGAHVTVSCSSCHTNGYSNTPTDCYSCHKANYESTTDPNHVASGFPTDCKQCHTTTSWQGATFDHSTTGFPLTGAHTSVSCSACHTTGYTNTASDCYSCHKTNYDNTNNPNHASANFPTDCTQCHTTSGWTPSTWNHDSQYFPIYSGTHLGRWNACSDCHTIATNYASHTCNAICHKTDHHQNEDCYSCHPTGRGG
jgi:nitrate/TMAO reductase-like tetraheme cytochrome c subunit